MLDSGCGTEEEYGVLWRTECLSLRRDEGIYRSMVGGGMGVGVR